MAAALVIEDGTAASASANSYITIAEANSFCENHGLSSWADLENADKITAIIRGCAFVDAEYSFKGEKYGYDDPMEWPRVGVYADLDLDPSLEEYYQEIPVGLKKACCRAAYEESVSPGVLQSSLTSGIRREKIDVIETEYFGTTPSKTRWRTIEGFLKGLLNNSNTATVLRT